MPIYFFPTYMNNVLFWSLHEMYQFQILQDWNLHIWFEQHPTDF